MSLLLLPTPSFKPQVPTIKLVQIKQPPTCILSHILLNTGYSNIFIFSLSDRFYYEHSYCEPCCANCSWCTWKFLSFKKNNHCYLYYYYLNGRAQKTNANQKCLKLFTVRDPYLDMSHCHLQHSPADSDSCSLPCDWHTQRSLPGIPLVPLWHHTRWCHDHTWHRSSQTSTRSPWWHHSDQSLGRRSKFCHSSCRTYQLGSL